METFFHKHILPVSALLLLLAGVLFSTQASALGKPSNVGTGTQVNPGAQYNPQTSNSLGTGSNIPSSTTSGQQGSSRMPGFAKTRLQDAKLRACQAISNSLTTRSSHLVDLVKQQEKTFTSIAEGVEQYYLTKVVPTGKTLSNYDALVADIATKQSAIASLVQAAQTDVTNFSCTGNNPAAQLTQYRTDMQAVIKALQDYRTSIKNLIVAVRTLPSVNPAVTPSAAPTATPTPTPTPSVTPSATP